MAPKDNEISDRQLWGLFQQGDNQALGTLLTRYHGKILGAVYYIIHKQFQSQPDLEDIKDAIQEMGQRILEQKERHSSIDLKDFSSWAVQYVLNIWRNNRSKEQNREKLRKARLTPKSEYYEIDLLIEKTIFKKRMIDCISDINNPTYQKIIYLIVVEGYESKEIAVEFDKPLQWAYDKKNRAIKSYKKVLEKKGLLDY